MACVGAMAKRDANNETAAMLRLLCLCTILWSGTLVGRWLATPPSPRTGGDGNASSIVALLDEHRGNARHHSIVATLGTPTLLARSPEFDPTTRVHWPPASSANSLHAPNSRVMLISGSHSWALGLDTRRTLAQNKRTIALAALTALESITQSITQEPEWRHSEWINQYVMDVAKLVKLDATIGRAECDGDDAFNSDECEDWATLLHRLDPVAVDSGVNPFAETYALSHVRAAAVSDPEVTTALGPLAGDGEPLREFGVANDS